MSNVQSRTSKITKIGIMTALSIVLLVIFKLIPGLGALFTFGGFLEYDPADIPIFIGTFAFGPLGGLLMTVIVSVFQALVFSATGVYGMLMHIIATGTFVLVAGNIYRINKTKKGALISLICGTLAMTAIMVPANLIVTARFFGMPASAIVPMLPMIIAFNLGKAGFNSLVTWFIYKPLSPFLHK